MIYKNGSLWFWSAWERRKKNNGVKARIKTEVAKLEWKSTNARVYFLFIFSITKQETYPQNSNNRIASTMKNMPKPYNKNPQMQTRRRRKKSPLIVALNSPLYTNPNRERWVIKERKKRNMRFILPFSAFFYFYFL